MNDLYRIRLINLRDLSALLEEYALNDGNIPRPKRRQIKRFRSKLQKMLKDDSLAPLAASFISILDEIESIEKAETDAEKLKHFINISEIVNDVEKLTEQVLSNGV